MLAHLEGDHAGGGVLTVALDVDVEAEGLVALLEQLEQFVVVPRGLYQNELGDPGRLEGEERFELARHQDVSEHTEPLARQLKQLIESLWLRVAPLHLPIEAQLEPVFALVGLAALLEVVPRVDVALLEIWLAAAGEQRFVLSCQFFERRVGVVREVSLLVDSAECAAVVLAVLLFIFIAGAHVALVGGVQVVALFHAEP